MLDTDKKKEIVSTLLNKGVLLDRGMLEQIDGLQDIDAFYSFLLDETNKNQEITALSELIRKYREESETTRERPRTGDDTENETISRTGSQVSVLFSYKAEPKKRVVQDFTGLFTSRYNELRLLLQNRKELRALTSISRLNQKREREQIALIGLITDKQTTKTGKVVLTAEDQTGTIKVIVSQNTEAFEIAKETVPDEVLGIVGTCAGDVVFASNLMVPDIPIYKEIKKSPDDVNALFISDFHFGSKLFLYDSFEKFITWIRAEQGSEAQKEAARKIKYLFILGDLVEGVGIYPNQEEDLEIKDIYEQYTKLAEYLRRIPKHIEIIICPGNHDAMRIAEPQPPLYKDFAEAIWEIPNVTMVSNPAYVNIHKSEGFPGFDVLMYHGFSFTHYADVVESIRSKGGQARSDLIMKFLLQRRHLAPTHKSTLYLPDAHKDSLVIDRIPDFFATGHIHRVAASSYRNVTLLNCSCWLERSDYQEKLGIVPDPGRTILVNLRTRKVKVLKFYDEKEEQNES